MTDYDVILVGSGINSLVCAAELTAKGRRVLVLERATVAGGCIQTAEVTRPGYLHDLFSMSYPLFVTTPFYPALQPKLAAEGVRMVNAAIPTGVLLPDGRYLLLRQDRARNLAQFDALHAGDGAAHGAAISEIETNAGLIFGLLGQNPASSKSMRLLGGTFFKRRATGMADFAKDMLLPARDWLDSAFGSDLIKALIAPWVLHVGLGPESPTSAAMAKVVMFTLEMVGLPFVEGGSAGIVRAFTRLIEAGGGAVITQCDVAEIEISRGRAVGVRTQDGRRFTARRAVGCNVTPGQLYTRLLPSGAVSQAHLRRAENFRFGRACMQIHLALSEPPRWATPELGEVGLLHLTSGMDGVSKAVGEAERGLLPVEGTIVVGQPAAADSSRCPPGTSLLWIQLQELPSVVKGDAAGLLDAPSDGRWTDDLAENYAQRIFARLRNHIANFDAAVVATTVLGPHALESANINLTGGDPYSGICSIDQFHILRPFLGASDHKTPVKNLYHFGASTHPGPGLSGTSGHLVAEMIG